MKEIIIIDIHRWLSIYVTITITMVAIVSNLPTACNGDFYFNQGIREMAGYVIFRENSDKTREYLLLKNKRTHQWTPPKGRILNGDIITEAAYRALNDYTGLFSQDIKVIPSFLKSITYSSRKHTNRITYRSAVIEIPEREIYLSPEHTSYKWLKLEEANKCADVVTRRILQECEEFLVRTRTIKQTSNVTDEILSSTTTSFS